MATRDAAKTSSDRARTAIADHLVPDQAEAEIHRFIVGLDEHVRPMTKQEVEAELDDPFARLLLRQGIFPTTFHEVLDAITAATPDGDPLRTQVSCLVGEGSQILFSEAPRDLARGLRLAFCCGTDNKIDVLVSTAARGDLAARFLQVLGWDETHGVFHYYERKSSIWVWAGNSFHSLDAPSRGQGPFDSHVNGGLVMKELKFPWNHWSSVAAKVPPEIFAPDDPARNDPFVMNPSGGEFFQENVVQPGIERWTDARLAMTTKPDGTVEQAQQLLRQLFATTTVNLTSTVTQSSVVTANDSLALPPTFFVDADALTLEQLGLPAPPAFTVSGELYLDALKDFDVALVDGDFRQPGDTHFAFLVPERAFEDLAVVKKCLAIGLISPRFVACALMIDFSNPIFSPARAALLAHVPQTARLAGGTSDLEAGFVEALTKAAEGDAGPEKEFLEHWNLGEGWKAEFTSRLNAYYSAVNTGLSTKQGWEEVFRLAEWRRRQMMGMELSEGRPLLFAKSNISDGITELLMAPDASITPGGGK